MIKLTAEESVLRAELESAIRKTFEAAGAALAEIRDKRLYRNTDKTFEDYCQRVWGWNRKRSHQLIQAAKVVKQLPPSVSTIVDNEGQARELAKVEPEKRVEVLDRAKAAADQEQRPMTARDIQQAAEPAAPILAIAKVRRQPPVLGHKSRNELQTLKNHWIALENMPRVQQSFLLWLESKGELVKQPVQLKEAQ